MNRIATTLSIAVAFAAGCARDPFHAAGACRRHHHRAGHPYRRSRRRRALARRTPAACATRPFVSVDGATISIQDGNPPKHLHANANEIQYILEGTGTIWLGDKEVQVKPGDLVIIPKGTPHGGTKPDGRTIKAIAIKTPPQAPDDTKLLN